MDIYCATFWGEPKIPSVVTEDNLIASIASPVEETYIPESVEVTVANSLTVSKGRIWTVYYKNQLKQKLIYLIILLVMSIQL